MFNNESRNLLQERLGYEQWVLQKSINILELNKGKLSSHTVEINDNSPVVVKIMASEHFGASLAADLVNEMSPHDEPNYLKRRMLRMSWHNSALNRLKGCEIVFLDPDNGLQVKSVSLTGKKGNKYIGLVEIKDYFKLGKSIIFYNHRERKLEEKYLDKFRKLKLDPAFKGAEWLSLKFFRGIVRDYIFVLQPKHLYSVEAQCKALLNTAWKENFSLLCF